MIGRTLSRYRILEEIGAGGMGVVYRAKDERLERDVALKLLPNGSLNDETSRKRFRREALALSRLNHPHIGTIYDFDSAEGIDFLVMELVSGPTLEQKLDAGPLPEKEAAALGAEIAEALEEAHEHGVVHRDLKPGNVVLTPKGRAKVLDFGLAKLLEPDSEKATTRSLTEMGVAPGTLAYMAPEQLLGSPVDARTDLYALGVVLYRMASGKLPFDAELATALVYQILHETPPPLTRLRPEISSEFEGIVRRAMERDPSRRFPSAREMRLELLSLGRDTVPRDSIGAPRAGRGRISLAVLPLANLSGDPGQEFFSDGMTDAITTNLAKIGGLKVISRTSAMRFKGSNRPLPEIARELGVESIVEGSVLRSETRVRITVELIDAKTDENLWAESYERDLSDILALQGEVARAITSEIRVQLTPDERKRLATARSVDPLAYEAYLKGRYLWGRRSEESLRKSIEFFRTAIERDPTYALAHTGMADSYDVLGFMEAMTPEEAFGNAKAAAQKALAIDESLGEAHASLGYAITYYDWDWAAAEGEFRRAIELNPGYATAHHFYGNLLVAVARMPEALASADRALELDPLSLIITTFRGWVLYYHRRYDEAIEAIRRAIELDPTFGSAHLYLGALYMEKSWIADAMREFDAATRLLGRTSFTLGLVAHAYAVAGKREEALEMREELRSLSRERYVSAWSFALIEAGLGDTDAAFEQLEKALAERSNHLVRLPVEPRMDSLRADPRFESVVRRLRGPAQGRSSS